MATREDNNLNALFGPAPDCPAIDDLVPQLEGRRGEDERRRAESHVAECARCKTELALLREFESPSARAGEQRAVEWIVARLRANPPYSTHTALRRPWWKRIWTLPVLAPASVVLAVALIAFVVAVRPPRTAISSTPSGPDVMRSQSVALLKPIGDQARPPSALSWNAVPGASRYRVRVLEVDRTELWAATTPESSVSLPDSVRNQIVPLKTLLWDVSALDAAGNVLATSGGGSFRFAPSNP